METLSQLHSARGLYIRCPNSECNETFSVRDAALFDATRKLPKTAAERLAEQQHDVLTLWQSLRKARANLKRRSFTATATSGVGQILEMVAASLPGLPAAAQDCRVLLKPIDYLAFKGACAGKVTSISFVEVKTGRRNLSPIQRAVKDAVESGA